MTQNKGNKLTREQNSRGGKKSKRGPSIKTQLREILETDAPTEVLNRLKERGFTTKDKTLQKALTVNLIASALEGESWASKLIIEHLEGKPVQNVEMSGKVETTIEVSRRITKT